MNMYYDYYFPSLKQNKIKENQKKPPSSWEREVETCIWLFWDFKTPVDWSSSWADVSALKNKSNSELF